MASAYQVAPIFLIRMAGVPFDVLENVATRDTSVAARELLARQSELAKAKSDVEHFLQSHGHDFSKELFRAWKKTVRSSGVTPPDEPPSGVFAVCRESASKLATAETFLQQSLQRELDRARAALLQSAQTALPAYLVFIGEATRERLAKQYSFPPGVLPPRNKQERAHERTLLLYLQRICAKNDSLSEFGPASWGKIDKGIRALTLTPKPGIGRRECFLERWTAHGAAAALNADPDIRLELSPRLNPNGRVQGNQFVFTDTGETVRLAPDIIKLLGLCNGETPAHSLGVEPAVLEQLAQQNIIRWEVEVPALEPHAFDVLISDVSRWRDGLSRKQWLDRLQPIAALPASFAQTTETISRIQSMDEARRQLEQLGAERKTTDRFLYSAANPIGEECFRETRFAIGENLMNEVAIDAAPWIDLWRDCYAFVASRVAAGVRVVFEQMPIQNGAAPLPAFLRACESAGLPLTGPGLVALAHIAFQEVKTAFFSEKMKPHLDKAEYELTPDDCRFVRQHFQYEKFDEYTYPSADMQLAAKSVEAVARGEYQWVLAELHPPVAMLHHGFYWSCPDEAALSHALASTLFVRPNFYFGFFAADFTATTAVRLFDAVPALSNFVAPQRSNPNWSTVRPADAEVYVDASGDVCVRKIDNHTHLGSFARAWVIPLGFHPFTFSLGETTPRLHCGKIIVQRRAWTVRQEELGAGDFTGISRDLVLAVERLRGKKDLPRYIYIRPTEQALRRSGAEGRDKDTKPVFIDLESYLFLEIFYRWLTKAGELELTEMLPSPDDLLWQESDGRRTFELRTLIVPRA